MKYNNLYERNDNRKVLFASAAVAALISPLAFASPSVAIARTQSSQAIVADVKRAATMPSQTEFNTAKQNFINQNKVYQDKVQAYNQAKATNLPLPNYQDVVAEQDTKINELEEEIKPLINQLNTINDNITSINTENTEKLTQMLNEYNASAQAVKDAQNELASLQAAMQKKLAEDKATIKGLNEKAQVASDNLNTIKSEYNAFRATYDQKAEVYQAQKSIYQNKLTSINAEITSLKDEISHLPKESEEGHAAAKDKAAALQKNINALEAEYEKINEDFLSTNRSYEELSAQYNKLQTQFTDAKAAVDAANAATEQTNAYIKQQNANLKKQCDEAQSAYDTAIELHNKMQVEYDSQVAKAQADNQKNSTLYQGLKTKIDELSTLVDQYNTKRNELAEQAQNAKTSIDDAYNAALDAYNALTQLRQKAETLVQQYNASATAYNTSVQDEYNAQLKEYNDAQAKFQAEVDRIKKENAKDGVLSKPAWQGLTFGKGPMRQIADGGVIWENNVGGVVTEGNKVFAEIAPQQTATAVYTGNAVKGILYAGKQISRMTVSYANQNAEKVSAQNGAAGPVWIGADADIRAGYACCYKITDPKIQSPMNPGSAFSYQADRPDWIKFFVEHDNIINASQGQNLIVTFKFYDENNNLINFSERYPADIYLPNLYKEQLADDGIIHIKLLGSNIFNEIIPITGSSIDQNQDVYVYNPYNGQPFLVHNGVVVSKDFSTANDVNINGSWDDINNPEFYKNCILTVRNQGNTIAFAILSNNLLEKDTPATRAYSDANNLGYNQMFLTNIASVELPMVPTIQMPKPPTLAQVVDLGLADIGDAPTLTPVEVPAVVTLEKPDPLSPLNQITPKNIVPKVDIQPATCPVPVGLLPVETEPNKLVSFGIQPPASPERLPEVPQVPSPQVPKKSTSRKPAHLAKTADVSAVTSSGIIAVIGSMLAAFGVRRKNN